MAVPLTNVPASALNSSAPSPRVCGHFSTFLAALETAWPAMLLKYQPPASLRLAGPGHTLIVPGSSMAELAALWVLRPAVCQYPPHFLAAVETAWPTLVSKYPPPAVKPRQAFPISLAPVGPQTGYSPTSPVSALGSAALPGDVVRALILQICPSDLVGQVCNALSSCPMRRLCTSMVHWHGYTCPGPDCPHEHRVKRSCRTMLRGATCRRDDCEMGHDWVEERRDSYQESLQHGRIM